MKLSKFIKQAEKIGVGNKCLVKFTNHKEVEAKLQFENDVWYICNDKFGLRDSCSNELGYEVAWSVKNDSYHESGIIEYLKPLEKTWDNLEVGDILVKKNNNSIEHKVLGLCREIIFPSNPNDFDIPSPYWYTKKFLQKKYTIKQPPKEEEVQEMTVEEVSRLVGKKVKIVE